MAKGRDMLDEVTLDDLQEQHREIAECVGLEGFRALVREFGGNSVHIPQEKEAVKLFAYRRIKEEFDGANVRALSRKYGVSESTVYSLIRQQIKKRPKKGTDIGIPGQMDLADILKGRGG